jgi:hypothetical protein
LGGNQRWRWRLLLRIGDTEVWNLVLRRRDFASFIWWELLVRGLLFWGNYLLACLLASLGSLHGMLSCALA